MPRSPTLPSRRLGTTTEASIVLTLFDLVNCLDRGGEALARQVELTTKEWLVLLHIAGDPNFPGATSRVDHVHEGVLPSDIAAARGVSRAHISVLVSRLLERGLVRHVHDAADGRRRRLAATPAGWRTLETVEPIRRLANRRLFAALAVDERRTLLRQLRGCLALLRRDRAVPVPKPATAVRAKKRRGARPASPA